MRPIKFIKKEWGLAALSVCLALASFRPQDATVFTLMLVGSWIALLYLAYHHQGKQGHRLTFVLVVTLILGFVAYRDFSGIDALKSPPARLEVTNVIPVPAQSEKGKGLFVNVFYANHGKLPIRRMVHRCVVQYPEKPLSAAQETALMATADALKFPESLPDDVEIESGDSPKYYFTCQQSDKEISGSALALDVLRTEHRLYVAIAMKYQDDITPRSSVMVTEFCGWFNRTFDMWHNCGKNRIFIQPL